MARGVKTEAVLCVHSGVQICDITVSVSDNTVSRFSTSAFLPLYNCNSIPKWTH